MTENIVVSCVHNTIKVPHQYKQLFKGFEKKRRGAAGSDIGASELGKEIANELKVQLYKADVTRLLVELDCSLTNKKFLFSEITGRLDEKAKKSLLKKYYFSYYKKLGEELKEKIRMNGTVLHLLVHSFAPVWKGKERNADIGILYDTRRLKEKKLAEAWIMLLKENLPKARIRKNYPYRGTEDGIVSYFRKKLPHPNYSALEIEVNNARLRNRLQSGSFRKIIAKTFYEMVQNAAKKSS